MNRSIWRALPLLVWVSAMPSAWSANDLFGVPLENLLQLEVAGASRFSQPLAEAPAAVSVVSAEDAKRFGYRTLGEMLQSVRSVYTTDGRDYSYLGIRGFARPGDYNTRMLMMVDGVRRNDPLYDTAPIGHDAPVEVEWIKQLEFVPGPASALYGSNAIFGVANAVLWSGADLNGSRVMADVGSGNMTRLGFLTGQRTEAGGDWVFGLSSYRRRGEDIYFKEFDMPGMGNGVAHGLDGENTLKTFAKFNSGNWQINTSYSVRRKDVPTAYYGTLFDVPGNFVDDRSGYADLAHSKLLAVDWTQNLRFHVGSYQYKADYVYPGLVNRDESTASWWGLDYLLTYTGYKSHKLLFGADYQRNRHLDQRNFDLAPQVMHFDDRRTDDTLGLYVQDEWRIDSRWMANLGFRLDQRAGFSAASPRAALIFHPVPEATLKLIHGQAFRAPNNYERYYNDGGILQKSNLDLKPERITTNELAADYALSPRLRLSGSYFRYRIDDLVDQIVDPNDGLQVFINRAPVHTHGLEMEAEATLPVGMRLKGSLTWQRRLQPHDSPENSPRLMGKLQMTGPLGDSGWHFGLGLGAVDPRATTNGVVPGQVLGNLTLSQGEPGRLGEWSLGIYNLSGRRYLDPASSNLIQSALPQDGRQFRLGWKISY